MPKKIVEELGDLLPHQTDPIALSLTFLGGFIDSFAFINFDNTLPVAQSGNMVLLTSDLINGDLLGIGIKLTTLVCFIIGLISSRFFHRYHKTIYWRVYALLMLALSILVTLVLKGRVLEIFVLAPLSFSLAFITGSFNRIDEELYNNSFTTGNMKKAIIAWTEYGFKRDKKDHQHARMYSKLVLAFITGALGSALCQKLFGDLALLVAVALVLGLSFYYCRLVRHFQKS